MCNFPANRKLSWNTHCLKYTSQRLKICSLKYPYVKITREHQWSVWRWRQNGEYSQRLSIRPLASSKPRLAPSDQNQSLPHHHQSWQWQIYCHLAGKISPLVLWIYISTGFVHWHISLFCKWIRPHDHKASITQSRVSREMLLRNAWGLLPWCGCLDRV